MAGAGFLLPERLLNFCIALITGRAYFPFTNPNTNMKKSLTAELLATIAELQEMLSARESALKQAVELIDGTDEAKVSSSAFAAFVEKNSVIEPAPDYAELKAKAQARLAAAKLAAGKRAQAKAHSNAAAPAQPIIASVGVAALEAARKYPTRHAGGFQASEEKPAYDIVVKPGQTARFVNAEGNHLFHVELSEKPKFFGWELFVLRCDARTDADLAIISNPMSARLGIIAENK